jgi:hypothetical protein
MSDSATTERTDEKRSAGSIRTRPKRVLSGEDPFDEATMMDDEEPPAFAEHPVAGHPIAKSLEDVQFDLRLTGHTPVS